ncbi:hypothetical protein RhiirA4_473621 [Rhizophagus irregularis]|uniref:Crinkler effector protein N-terminal domain-containing protein n=1 Tax=Rhizophagus irregularis TaxID=588596 RepID=A0A2I1H725_9GLOM|nr:hypothetical protein RhiirA4_473621 [Rhizophagus irregularis]
MPSLSCFIVGTSYEATISIKVEKEDTIDVLREKIKVNKDYEFDEQGEFTIWKINLLKREYQKKAGSQDSLEAIYHLIWALRLRATYNYLRQATLLGIKELDRYVFVDDSNLFIEGKFAVGTREMLGCSSSRDPQLQEFRIGRICHASTILKTAVNQRRERLEENSADEDKVDKSRSSSMEPRKEDQTRMKISSKEATEFITDYDDHDTKVTEIQDNKRKSNDKPPSITYAPDKRNKRGRKNKEK